MNLNDDFAFSHSVVQGVPGAVGVRVGIIEDGNDKIAFVNHVLVAVEIGIVAAFFCRNRMHEVGFFEDGLDFLAAFIVTFVRLGNFQRIVIFFTFTTQKLKFFHKMGGHLSILFIFIFFCGGSPYD